VANTVMVAIVANPVPMMLRFSGAERTSEEGESEDREQCALHLKISNQGDRCEFVAAHHPMRSKAA